MKTAFCILILAAATTLLAEDIKTIGGTIYKNITVTRVDPNGISVTHDDGLAKIPFTDLTPDLQTKYGYDPKKAAEFNAALQSAAVQRVATAKAAAAVKEKEAANPPVRIWGYVENARKDGLLVKSSATIEMMQTGLRPSVDPNRPKWEQGKFFLIGHPAQDKIVDDESLDVDAVEDGTHSYAGGKLKQYKVMRVYKKPW